MWVAVADVGTRSSIAYSYDGINWIGIGNTIFTSYGLGVSWNGSMWVAVGGGTNSIAYSYDGINWTGLGTSIFTGYGVSAVWNGFMWVAVGNPNNTIAYSYDGINWIGLGASIFSSYGAGCAWNGRVWVAAGIGTNSIAYSYDGIQWTGLGNSITTNGIGVAWNGTMFVIGCAVSPLTNSLAYSYDGITWVGLGSTVFTSNVRNIAWNGAIWIAVGEGTNTLAYSYNGINWIGMGTGYSPGIGMGISFNSARPHRITFPAPLMVAAGSGTNTLAYSVDGITWTGSGSSIFMTQGNGVASNGAMWVATGSGANTLAYSTTDIETPYIHLPFENGLYKDVMGNSNVSLVGSVSYVAGARGSTAVNLSNPGASGVNYLLGAWTGSSSFTVSFWFNMRSYANGQAVMFSSNQGSLLIIIYNTSLSIYSNAAVRISSGAQPSTNTWYYLTYIHQTNGLCSLYLNNVFVGSYTNSGGLATSSGNFALATYDVATITPFNGYIDDFRIYNYAITMNPRITWRGLGTSIFSTQGKNIAWNGSMWVAVGNGTNSIAYSYDGITWMGLGTSVLTLGNGIAWSGSMWIAVGSGTNSIAYSYDGLRWTGIGTSIFTSGNGVAWNGTLWVAVGSGTNTIAYSYDGMLWTGLGATLFTSSGNGIAWNGSQWVATGTGTNTILYSTNGINWTSAVSCFTTSGNGVAWNGTRWIAVGSGGNTIGYSADGSTWNKSQNITPTQISLSSNTWVQDGVLWMATASSTNPGYAIYNVFNNTIGSTTGTGWLCDNVLQRYTNGSPNANAAITVIQTIGSTAGEWLQIQSSIPLVISSFALGIGPNQYPNTNTPKTYYIVGSNNGTTWYPLQYGTFTITAFTALSSYININTTGTQTLTSTMVGSVATTAYSYATSAYTYFRLIGTSLMIYGGSSGTTYMEVGEFSIKFNDTTIFSTSLGIASNAGLPGTVTIQHPVVAVGSGANSLAYSPDGVRWTGLGTTIFSSANAVTWNGTKWIACGTGSNTLAYSYDGLRWTSLGATIFSASGNGVAWNGSLWVAVGGGTNSIVYSTDGLGWGGSATGNAIFTTCNAVACSGSQWVAVGAGTNSIAYSADGKVWTAVSATVFSTQGNGVCWTGSLWVAVGSGTNTIAYSYDGVSWTGLGTSIFSTSGNGVCWNGTRWVAVGAGTNTLAYSANGTSWIGFGSNYFSVAGNGVCWTGTRFVAVGSGSISMIYSTDGLTWNIVRTITPSSYLPFDGTPNDIMGKTVSVTGTLSYVTGAVGPQAVNLVNTAGGTATNYIVIPWTTVSSFTISIRFNIQSVGGTYLEILSADTNGYLETFIHVPSMTLQVQVPGGGAQIGIGTAPVVQNTWYHLVQIFQSNGTCSTFLNGVLMGSGTNTSGTTGTSWSNLTIGKETNSNSFAFNGYIDDLRIYNIAVSNIDDLTAEIFTQGNGVAGNPRLGGVVCDSQISLIDSTTLDVVSDSYYNTGYTEMSATIQSQTLVVDASSVAEVVLSTPGAPTNVVGALYPSGAASGIRVTFSYPTYTGGGISAYYASAIDTASIQPTVIVSAAAPPITINGLVPGTTYRIQVYASNSAGQSVAAVAASNVFFQVPPTVPQNYAIALDPPTNPTGIVVSFTAPAISGGVTNYTVTAYQGVTPFGSAQTGTALSYTFTGFTAGTAYNFSAYGTNTGGVGTSINSSITYYTKPDTPSITGVTLDPSATPTGVSVAFTTNGANGGGVLTYVATAYLSGVATALTASGSTSPLKITGLTPGTSYTYKVVASNPAVSSDSSLSSALLTYFEQPSTPTIQSVTLDSPTDPTGISVAFVPSSYTGGGTLTYTVTAYISGNATAFTASGSSSPLKVTGLIGGTPYTFKVVASNALVSSAASAASSTLNYYTKPGVPTGIGATLHPTLTPTGVNVSFTSGNTGGGTILYTATAYYNGNSTGLVASGGTSPLKITGLTPGQSYTYKVVASNVAVPTIVSDTSNASTLALYQTNPSAPRSVTATSSLGSATISWLAPLENGGTNIKSYRVVSTPATYDSLDLIVPTPTTVTVTGLTNGAVYTFTVTATNNGNLTSSATTPSVTIGIAPGAPTILLETPALPTEPVYDIGSSGVFLKIYIKLQTVPSNNGIAIDNYRYSITGGTFNGTWVPLNNTFNSGDVLSFVGGFSPSSSYTFYVQAHNTAGWSSSGTATFTWPALPVGPGYTSVVDCGYDTQGQGPWYVHPFITTLPTRNPGPGEVANFYSSYTGDTTSRISTGGAVDYFRYDMTSYVNSGRDYEGNAISTKLFYMNISGATFSNDWQSCIF